MARALTLGQCSLGKTRPQNDLLCVERDVKLYTLTHLVLSVELMICCICTDCLPPLAEALEIAGVVVSCINNIESYCRIDKTTVS